MELEVKQSASLLMPSENVYDLSIGPWERDQGPRHGYQNQNWAILAIRTNFGLSPDFLAV